MVEQEAPNQMGMGGGDFGMNGCESILVKQTARGCLQECLGCDAKSEYQISQHDWSMQEKNGFLRDGARNQKDILYTLEQSGFFMRCCCKDGRAMEMPVTSWGSGEKGSGGPTVMTLKKDLGFPVVCSVVVPVDQEGNTTKVDIPCCCLLPAFKAHDANGTLFSETKYVC